MKKTFVDLTYFSFSNADSGSILKSCQSTIGFLEKLSAQFEVHFVVQSEKIFLSTNQKNIQIHFYKGKTLYPWQIPFRFNEFIKSLKPDYILVHGFGTAHYLIFLKMICPKAKIVLQCNGFAPKPKGIRRLIFTISNRFIDGYLFTGIENAKPWYKHKILSRNKIFEVMEGSVQFRFKDNDSRKGNSFIWVGRLDENKDPLTILKAFHRFLAVEPKAKLTMVFHEGHLEYQVAEYIAANNLTDAVELRGFVAQKHLEKLYHEHCYFILGSHYEGSGYALLESMACGCVPIVTTIPSFEYMTDNGNCGLLFSPENEEELVTQLKKIRTIDYVDYQQKVLNHFEKKLSFQAIADEIAQVFQSL